MSTKTLMTDEELMQLADDGHKYEYIDGKLKVTPAGMLHESITVSLINRFCEFLKKEPLGKVYGSSAGYRMNSGNVLSPDVSFVRESKLPGGKSPEGFAHFAPDLAVEILSPSDSWQAIEDKIKEYFENGLELVWLVNPQKRVGRVYDVPDNFRDLDEEAVFAGDPVLPGFSIRLKDLLE